MRRNRTYQKPRTPVLEKVAEDLPKGYLKAGLDLYNGVGSTGKMIVAGGVVLAALAFFNRKK